MKPWTFLVTHELHNARSSLGAAAVLQAFIVGLVHSLKQIPSEAAPAVAIAIGVLTTLWTLHLAADCFAGEFSSGRLATRALLPVSSRMLWSAKLAALGISIAALLSVAVAFECGLQLYLGDVETLQAFLVALPPTAESIVVLVLVAAVGVLCSMLVENALTALLLTALVLGAMWGLRLALEDALYLIGERWSRTLWTFLGAVCGPAVLVLGLWTFSRGQRRLGSATVRLRTALMGVAIAMLSLAGTAAAAGWHFTRFGLEDRNLQPYGVVTSPDGRFVALECGMPYYSDTKRVRPNSVWLLDLETGEQRLVALCGQLCRNDIGDAWEPWSERLGLQVEVDDFVRERVGDTLRLDVVEGELREQSIGKFEHAASPHMPDWAQWTRGKSAVGGDSVLRVRWKGTEFEHAFRGDGSETRLGLGIFLSATPGRVLARRADRLVLVDIATSQERVLIDHGVVYARASPDAQALIVHTATESHVLSTLDGSALHAPWPTVEGVPRWIQGDDRNHELFFHPSAIARPSPADGRFELSASQRIINLAHDRELELEEPVDVLGRLGDRGYACFNEHGNLIWIDRAGKLVRVLIDRSGD